ncbi:major facilitator superfamily domain-containing protein [Hypoxylon argillaceum]|nr:major facilitator superfamily domain-containing protein [Hypoxylon argillaceum]
MDNSDTPDTGSPPRIPWLTMLVNQGVTTPPMLTHHYTGSGLPDDAYQVTFLKDDPRDPLRFPSAVRWALCAGAGYLTFCVAYISSAYAGAIGGISADLNVSSDLTTLGLSLFLLGFVLGPFLWAPCSELWGRQIIFLTTGVIHVALNIAICFSTTLPIILVLRLLSGGFGAATLTNSGGVIADVFLPRERGLAITVYALVALFAPVLGPIVGSWVAETYGWRCAMAWAALLSASALAVAALLLPETYAPVLLEKRAKELTRLTGRVHVSAMASTKGGNAGGGLRGLLATNLSRPFLLAANEPIISLLALYQAVVFGTLYLTFTAFPIVYTDILGWPKEKSGLSFLGILFGMSLSVVFAVWDNARYSRNLAKLAGRIALPETRLPACCAGGICITVGLLWFAWSASSRAHWLVNMASGCPFGFGIVLVTIGSTNYIVDAYTIYAASALTVCICGRAICGAAFPLFVRGLFASVGIWWGLSIPAFLSLLCATFPFALYRYGPVIRARCKYAGQAEMAVQRARQQVNETTPLLS